MCLQFLCFSFCIIFMTVVQIGILGGGCAARNFLSGPLIEYIFIVLKNIIILRVGLKWLLQLSVSFLWFSYRNMSYCDSH